ncbi:MAG: MMPL family transporter, partial [Flavobacteriales bacterium]
MWGKIGAFILRYRIPLGILVLAITAIMGWQSQYARMSYKFGGVLPKDDSTYVEYQHFIEQFSEDGNVLAIGYRDERMWELHNFLKWRQLVRDLQATTVEVDGSQYPMVDSIFSTGNCYNLVKDTALQRFEFQQLIQHEPASQAELDSAREQLHRLPFYEGLLYKKDTGAGLMMVFVNNDLFNSENRGNAVERMLLLTDQFTRDTGIQTYVSGMPYIRSVMSVKVKAELKFFTILSAVICMVLLLLFFRSFKVTMVVMSVVVVSVVIAMGSIALFDYPITMLMGL